MELIIISSLAAAGLLVLEIIDLATGRHLDPSAEAVTPVMTLAPALTPSVASPSANGSAQEYDQAA